MKTGPITRSAARRPMSGQRGPSQVCTISTSTPPPTSTNLQTTSIPRLIPRTCRYRISPAGHLDQSVVEYADPAVMGKDRRPTGNRARGGEDARERGEDTNVIDGAHQRLRPA